MEFSRQGECRKLDRFLVLRRNPIFVGNGELEPRRQVRSQTLHQRLVPDATAARDQSRDLAQDRDVIPDRARDGDRIKFAFAARTHTLANALAQLPYFRGDFWRQRLCTLLQAFEIAWVGWRRPRDFAK